MNISLSADKNTVDRLKRVAKALNRPRSWVAIEALDQYLSYHEHFIRAVEDALAEAEDGASFLSHADVVAASKARSKARAR